MSGYNGGGGCCGGVFSCHCWTLYALLWEKMMMRCALAVLLCLAGSVISAIEGWCWFDGLYFSVQVNCCFMIRVSCFCGVSFSGVLKARTGNSTFSFSISRSQAFSRHIVNVAAFHHSRE